MTTPRTPSGYRSKRPFDIAAALLLLLFTSPILLVCLFAVWLQDGKSPIYKAPRVARGGGSFLMIKLRSMIVGADRTGVESTSATDARITGVGHFVRRWKIDELPQLWNVLRGEMSLVGPRPNTQTAVAGYSEEEKHLLDVRPGITDFSSVVFSDESEILKDAPDPDQAYDVLIRPWKSRLGLLYVRNASLTLDLKLNFYTVAAVLNKRWALDRLSAELLRLGADERLVAVSRRLEPLGQAAPIPSRA